MIICQIDSRLLYARRPFSGIPGRPWYKHVVYAPGLWSGYGADTFPTLNEAIEGAIEGRTSWADILDVQEKLAIVVRRVAAVLRVEN